ncbi:10970_t:CDS:2 [Acaulospora colombiana]|uniref:10970_t:CDS:1 n=1 Tax=Acaulospora colombiana TaxID=27376 RepID=A0ACA9KAQ5_9GLOM|nr:10970_t:CDS:2 [Acaulospora colombiana]
MSFIATTKSWDETHYESLWYISYDFTQHPKYFKLFGKNFLLLIPTEEYVINLYGPEAQNYRAHQAIRGMGEFLVFRNCS